MKEEGEKLIEELAKNWALALAYRAEFDAALAGRKKRRWANVSEGALLRLARYAIEAALVKTRELTELVALTGKRFDQEHADYSAARGGKVQAELSRLHGSISAGGKPR